MLRSRLDVEVVVEIARPPEEVWEVLVDASRLPAWLEEFETAEVVGEPSEGVGATTHFRLSSGLSGTLETVESVPAERLAWDGPPQRSPLPGGRMRPRGYHHLRPTGDGGTRLVSHYQPELLGTAVVLRPYLGRWLRRQRPIDHARLKQLVEAGA
jgi:uncharacterized protein YndB with AHSA1/START domain